MTTDSESFLHVRLIGLTGNIATGKSAVAARLRLLGARVIDADQVARDVVEPGQPALDAITTRFGAAVLNADGSLNRKALGNIVFGDPAQLKALEAITHPAIRVAMRGRIAAAPAGSIIVLEVIRLFESGWADVCEQIWVSHCPEALQIERLMRGRGMSEADARARVGAQAPQSAKLARADVVIDTAGTFDETHRQVDAAWARFTATPARKPN
jgi:dephospho-CoA kinase